jgi:hypothetical protein
MENVRIWLGFSSMFVVDCIGRSGGLALLWGDETKLTIQNFSQCHINGLVENLGVDGSWRFTGIYGHLDIPKRP